MQPGVPRQEERSRQGLSRAEGRHPASSPPGDAVELGQRLPSRVPANVRGDLGDVQAPACLADELPSLLWHRVGSRPDQSAEIGGLIEVNQGPVIVGLVRARKHPDPPVEQALPWRGRR